MFVQAVSVGLALLTSGASSDLNVQEQRAWKRVAPSVVYVLQDGQPVGAAALIDDHGLFLASKSVIHSRAVDGRASDGHLVRLIVKATDEPTQLVLLEASDWEVKPGSAVRVADADKEGRSAPLLAVIGTGAIRAEMAWSGRLGVVAPTQRVMPLTEVRFEAPVDMVGGALVFDLEGRLVGSLNATLQSQEFQDSAQGMSLKMQRSGGPVPRGLGGGGGVSQLAPGPSPLTIAYSLGPDMIRRVVDGFCSPTHEVIHPSIGVYTVNNFGGGALVDGFVEGSSALKAGLKRGDVIVGINSDRIRDQIDFSRVMLYKHAGEKIVLLVKRAGMPAFPMDVVVGKSP